LKSRLLCFALLFSQAACISSSVLDPEDRTPREAAQDREWNEGLESDLPGTYVSEQLTGQLAVVLRMVVYRFEPDGAYTGAALLDGAPPHFEVISGSWSFESNALRLDDGPEARVHVASDGTLRLSGPDGTVILRRERPL
jgi:hypothetical protein